MISSISLDLKRLTPLGAVPEEPFRMKVKRHQLACKETPPITLKTVPSRCVGQELKTNSEPLVNGGDLHQLEPRHLLWLTIGVGLGDLSTI